MSNKKGFTIIETIIGIGILGLIGVMISFISPLRKKYNNDNNHALQYQLFLNTIESKKMNFKIKDIYTHEAIVKSTNNRKSYRIYYLNRSIVMSGIKSGYSPMLDDVKRVNFNEYKKHLEVHVLMINGEEYKDVTSISYE